LCLHHLLDSRLDDLPFLIVRDLQLVPVPFHAALEKLRGITPATTSVATAISRCLGRELPDWQQQD
jgi:hypothetical protein